MAEEASQAPDGGDGSSRLRIDVPDLELAQALDIVGAKWFAGRMARELADRKVTEAATQRGAVVRHKETHPLVKWRIEYDSWRSARGERPETPVTQTVVLLMAFARCLLKAQAADGLDRILRRLRIDDEFLAALFEIEIACSYLNRGWSVEFVEPGTRKAPDLKVINDKGDVLWVECKRRDLLPGRDQRTSEFWESLKERLTREWERTKTNVAVILRSTCDPVRGELEPVSLMLLEAGRQLADHPERRRIVLSARTRDGKYTADLQFLGDPDEMQNSMGAPMQEFDFSEMTARSVVGPDGKIALTNPKFFAFKNANPPDKYRGLLTTFRNAAKQLPSEGPGVIHIRLHLSGRGKAEQELDEVHKKLVLKLRGDDNRRVNAVVLWAALFEQDQTTAPPTLHYRHHSVAIEHTNPRAPFQ